MNDKSKRTSLVAIYLTGLLALSPASGFAQSATSFSGEAIGLKASALGVSVDLADTGALPSSGGSLSTSLANVNVAGIASADALSSSTSASGTTSQSQTSLADVNLLNSLVTATGVKSASSAACSGSTASTSGNAQLVGLTVAGQSILTSTPNLSISLPGGITVVINQQTSSSGASSGSITVNAIHVTGPSLDIVVGSAMSDITCS